MNLRTIASSVCAGILLIAFIMIGYNMSTFNFVLPTLFKGVDFSHALWVFRRLEILLQVMLIFTCALGILVFFTERDKK